MRDYAQYFTPIFLPYPFDTSIFCTISFRRLCCFSTRLDISLILQEITAPLYLHGFFKCTVEWVSVVLKQKGKVWNSTCAYVWPVPAPEELIDGRSGRAGSSLPVVLPQGGRRWRSLSVWREHVGYRMLICFKHTVFFISQSSLSLMSLILLVFFSAFFHCCPFF